MNIRVGQGFDVHALVENRPLIIAGVDIPYSYGLLGHSDADVLLHAVIDAILGAAALGDIGKHFPDTDMRFKGADSRALLRATVQIVADEGWKIINMDATVHAEAPKMGPHIPEMIENLTLDLGIEASRINIKAKTNEGLGHLGRNEGIAANVVVLLHRPEPE